MIEHMSRSRIQLSVAGRGVTLTGEAFLRGYGSPDFVVDRASLIGWDDWGLLTEADEKAIVRDLFVSARSRRWVIEIEGQRGAGRHWRASASAEIVARQMASRMQGTTLEMLLARRNIQLPDWDPLRTASIDRWKWASREFARGASGIVHAIVGKSLRPGNLWEVVELPTLKDNMSVTQIIQIDPLTGEQIILFTR